MTSYSDDEDDLLEENESLPRLWDPPTCLAEMRLADPHPTAPEQTWRMKERVRHVTRAGEGISILISSTLADQDSLRRHRTLPERRRRSS